MIKVLIVDDEKLAVKYYTQLINWDIYGFEIVGTANDGKEALNILSLKEPDIILTDIKMPVMDGIEFAKRARDINPDIHILFVTSFTDFSYAYNALKLGVDDYLMKDSINGEVLIGKLLEIAKKIKIEKNENDYANERVVEELFTKGRIGNEKLEWLGDRAAKFNGRKFYFLIIKRDGFLPAIAKYCRNEISKPQNIEMVIDLCRNLKDENFLPVSIFWCGDGIAVVLDPKQRDMGDSRSLLLDYSLRLQSLCAKAMQKSYSIFLVGTPKTLPEAGRLYKQSEERIQARCFLCNSLLTDIDSPQLETGEVDEVFDVGLIDNCIRENNFAQAHNYLSNYFEKIKGSKDVKAFESVFYNCLNLFKKYGQGLKGMKSGRIFVCELIENDKNRMYTVPDAMLWILEKLELLFSIRSEGVAEQYSKDTLEIIRFIMDNYSNQNLDIDNISKSVAMSAARTEVKFKCETGLTLIDYLNKYRIQKAMELLENGENKIYEISDKIGFSSSQYFSKVFKKYTALTPIEYRKRISNETRAKYPV